MISPHDPLTAYQCSRPFEVACSWLAFTNIGKTKVKPHPKVIRPPRFALQTMEKLRFSGQGDHPPAPPLRHIAMLAPLRTFIPILHKQWKNKGKTASSFCTSGDGGGDGMTGLGLCFSMVFDGILLRYTPAAGRWSGRRLSLGRGQLLAHLDVNFHQFLGFRSK